MGWFVIACICGFLGYWGWQALSDWLAERNQIGNADILSAVIAFNFLDYSGRQSLSNWLVRQHRIRSDKAGTLAAFMVFAIVLFGLVLWAICSRGARTLGEVVHDLDHGLVARFLLGLILGAGAAFVTVERPRVKSGDGEATPIPTPVPAKDEGNGDSNQPLPGPPTSKGDRSTTFGGGNSDVLPSYVVLSIAVGILVLALTAPYVDRWLQRLNGFKSAYFEFQLAASSTHKISIAEDSAIVLNLSTLNYLGHYDSRIEDDIEYFIKYGQNANNKHDIIQSAQHLLPTFTRIIGPAAKCVQTAINQGWLSIESARQMIAPAADIVEEIILGEDFLRENGKLEDKSDEFWKSVAKLPEIIHSRVGIPECTRIPQIYSDMETPRDLKALFPRFQDYKNVPYLHAAAALLISFVGDNDLRKADGQPVLDFKDFTFLFVIAQLSYHQQGRVGDIWSSYFGLLDELRSAARSRIRDLERAKEECGTTLDLLCFAQIYEVVAINTAAFYVAQDLARGNEYAKNYTARLEENTEEIKRLVSESDRRDSKRNAFYDYIQADKYSLLDTYAFARLVLEGGKPYPDNELIKIETIGVLKKVIEHGEEQIIKTRPQIDRFALSQLKISREHLKQAQELVGE